MNPIHALRKEVPATSLTPSAMCEDTAKRWAFMNQEVGPHQTTNLPARGPGLPSLQNCDMSVAFKPPRLRHFCHSSLNGLRYPIRVFLEACIKMLRTGNPLPTGLINQEDL